MVFFLSRDFFFDAWFFSFLFSVSINRFVSRICNRCIIIMYDWLKFSYQSMWWILILSRLTNDFFLEKNEKKLIFFFFFVLFFSSTTISSQLVCHESTNIWFNFILNVVQSFSFVIQQHLFCCERKQKKKKNEKKKSPQKIHFFLLFFVAHRNLNRCCCAAKTLLVCALCVKSNWNAYKKRVNPRYVKLVVVFFVFFQKKKKKWTRQIFFLFINILLYCFAGCCFWKIKPPLTATIVVCL